MGAQDLSDVLPALTLSPNSRQLTVLYELSSLTAPTEAKASVFIA